MKRRRQHISPLHQRRFSLVAGQHSNALPHLFNNRPADKDHLQRLLLQCARTKKHITRQLPPVAIPQNRHVQQAERFLRRIIHFRRQQNCSRARPENRSTGPRKFTDGVKQPFFLQELQLRCGFSAGQHDPVAPFQILHRAHFHRFRAQLLQHGRMRREITLYRHDSNLHGSLLLSCFVRTTRPDAYGFRRTPPGRFLSRNNLPAAFNATLQSPPYQPRVESKSFSSNCRTSIPGIASPSSSHASRIAFGSSKCVVAFTMAYARASGSLLLKMPEPTNTASAPAPHPQASQFRPPKNSAPATFQSSRFHESGPAARRSPLPCASTHHLAAWSAFSSRKRSCACAALLPPRCRSRLRPSCGSSPRLPRCAAPLRPGSARRRQTAIDNRASRCDSLHPPASALRFRQ